MPCQEIRAPPLLLPKAPEVLECVDTRWEEGIRASAFVILKEGACGNIRVLGSKGTYPTGSEFPATSVNGVTVGGGYNRGVDAEILAGAEAKSKDAGRGAKVAELVFIEDAELGEGLFHLVDGSGAVEELRGVGGVGEDIAGNEREESNGLTSAGGHL